MSIQTSTRANRFARLGFNGQLHEPAVHWQILGNGTRVYNPVLRRFHSPDWLSPFGRGGINAYAYCGCDPLNYRDPSGQFALPMMLLGLVAGAGGAGAAALASTGDRDDGGGSNMLPWIIGGAIAAVGMLAGVGMAGRQQLMKLGSSSGRAPGGSWANRAGSAASAVPSARPFHVPPRPSTPPRSRSPSPDGSVNFVQRDETGMVLKQMSDLPSPVSRKIVEIRDFGPRGRTPDPARVPSARPFFNDAGQLPQRHGNSFYHRYPIFNGTGHGYENWRIVTGSSYTGGIHAMYVTPNHYGSFFKVRDWRRMR